MEHLGLILLWNTPIITKDASQYVFNVSNSGIGSINYSPSLGSKVMRYVRTKQQDIYDTPYKHACASRLTNSIPF